MLMFIVLATRQPESISKRAKPIAGVPVVVQALNLSVMGPIRVPGWIRLYSLLESLKQ
jgi:hypothetical protein